FIGSPLRYRAGRIGEFLRVEGPPGLRRAVGAVVHLEYTESDSPKHSGALRSQSVALEPAVGEDRNSETDDHPPAADSPNGQDTNS
ncbi:MAG: threonine/serine exporter family protein, partial [Dietzia sp.]|nr:threonine/serine exporter family protein [Dietzia sp.]